VATSGVSRHADSTGAAAYSPGSGTGTIIGNTIEEREPTMQYFKPFTTLAVGIALGYFLVPKIVARIGG
jgi:hypothetical protein